MPFRIVWDEDARNFLGKKDKELSERILRKLREASKEPLRYVEILTSIKAFRLRVGDYRIILDIDWQSNIIYVRYLNHRKKIYKRFG